MGQCYRSGESSGLCQRNISARQSGRCSGEGDRACARHQGDIARGAGIDISGNRQSACCGDGDGLIAGGRHGGGRQRDVSAVQRDGARGEINRPACAQREIGCPCIDASSDLYSAARRQCEIGMARRWRVRRGQKDDLARKHRCAREIELAIAIPAREQAQISRACVDVRGDCYIIRRAKL